MISLEAAEAWDAAERARAEGEDEARWDACRAIAAGFAGEPCGVCRGCRPGVWRGMWRPWSTSSDRRPF
jgi:hypothetical protein